MKQLDEMTKDELDALIKDAQKAKTERDKQAREEAKDQINSILKETGFKLEDLFPRYAGPKTETTPGDIAYRDPNNPSNTWTGKGRKPRWLKEREDAGASLDEFKV